MPKSEDVFDNGLKIRREIFGPMVDQQVAGLTDFSRDMDDWVTRYCFGEGWSNPLLPRKVRSMLTLAMLVALGKPNQLRVHVRGAIQNGCSTAEIAEVLKHAMIYAGVPAGVDAFMNAGAVLKEMGLD